MDREDELLEHVASISKALSGYVDIISTKESSQPVYDVLSIRTVERDEVKEHLKETMKSVYDLMDMTRWIAYALNK